MIYEYRSYTVLPGRMEALQNRFRDHTLSLFKRHKIRLIGCFTPVIADASDRFIFILEFDSLAHRESAWAAFGSDPEWIKALEDSHKDGMIVQSVENKILAPTDFSPLK